MDFSDFGIEEPSFTTSTRYSTAAEAAVVAGGNCISGMVFLGDKLIIGDMIFDEFYVANTVEQLGKKLDKIQLEQNRAEKERRFADANRLMGDMLVALCELDTMRHVLKRLKESSSSSVSLCEQDAMRLAMRMP